MKTPRFADGRCCAVSIGKLLRGTVCRVGLLGRWRPSSRVPHELSRLGERHATLLSLSRKAPVRDQACSSLTNVSEEITGAKKLLMRRKAAASSCGRWQA